jgi:ribokinase
VAEPLPSYVIAGCLTTDSIVTATNEQIRRTCGGNALYAAAGVHVWDQAVGLVARVGEDYPPSCLDALGAALDLSGVRRLAGPHPIHVTFAYRADGSRTRRLPPDVIAGLPEAWRSEFVDDTDDDERYLAATPTPDDVPSRWLAESVGFHVPSLLTASVERLVSAIRTARPTALITLDAPWFARRDLTLATDLSILASVDVVLPSEADLRALHPEGSLVDAARDLLARGAPAVVVKVGAEGSIVVDADGTATAVPAAPVEAVDPTGAGDAFCGGFLVGLRETGDLLDAAAYGTASASFAVEERSALPVFSVRREVAEARRELVRSRIRTAVAGDRGTVSA